MNGITMDYTMDFTAMDFTVDFTMDYPGLPWATMDFTMDYWTTIRVGGVSIWIFYFWLI